jgi:predicted glycosyltransferase
MKDSEFESRVRELQDEIDCLFERLDAHIANSMLLRDKLDAIAKNTKNVENANIVSTYKKYDDLSER